MTITSTTEPSMNDLSAATNNEDKPSSSSSLHDFNQWKQSISQDVRLPGGLTSEAREKVNRDYRLSRNDFIHSSYGSLWQRNI